MNVVAYMRVSTAEQGRSGLGLEAQRAAIKRFAEAENLSIAAWIEEVQSGKAVPNTLAKRPGLAEALRKARELKGPVIVARLDRLSRDVHFVSGLMAEKVPFICCDLGKDVEPFMLHIYAAVAEKERELIRRRIKDALAAKVARGEKPNGGGERAKKGGESMKVKASTVREQHRAMIEATAHLSLKDAAMKLNWDKQFTVQGVPWTVSSLSRMRQKLNIPKVKNDNSEQD